MKQPQKLIIEDRISRLFVEFDSNKTSLAEITIKINDLIRENLTEALNSSSEFVREKAKQLNKVGK